LNTVKTELLANPQILGVTICNQTPTFIPGKYNMSYRDREMIVGGVRVDKDFIKTLGLHLKSGSDFTLSEQEAAFAGTDTIQRSLMINESAASLLGWTRDEALGKSLKFQGRNSVIKGVVQDFHFSSMHESIGPIVIFIGSHTRNLLVKLSGEQVSESIQFLKSKWNVFAPHRPFEYEFLDEQFDKLYKAEDTTSKLFYSFALLAIVLACLGLLGLITYSAQQRTKEIGIRKVLGASVAGIVMLLSKDFLKLIAIAAVIAFPLAWWVMNKWLQDFAYRASINWWIFAVAGVVALLIGLITISFQAIRAAIANPVKSLRTE
jgi:putative ABC transport system permease protein